METKEKSPRYAFGGRQGRGSEMSTAVPVWGDGIFKPVILRLIGGKAELLSRMNIVSELDIALSFGIDRSKVRHGVWEMVTFNGGNHRYFL